MTKFYADTNIIIRILTNDDEAQVNTLAEVIDRGAYTFVIPSVVIIECCWVLKKVYGFSNLEIANALIELTDVDNIEVEETLIINALNIFGQNNLDIVDVYLSVKSTSTETPILSWDKGYERLQCEFYKPEQL